MNEAIDLTISKLFLRKLDNGFRAYLDDENNYLMKYGEEGSQLQNNRNDIFASLAGFGRDNFFEKEDRHFKEDCEVAKENILDIPYKWNYPMGMGDNCDCCGVLLNVLNKTGYSICETCGQYLEDTQDGRQFEL